MMEVSMPTPYWSDFANEYTHSLSEYHPPWQRSKYYPGKIFTL